MGLMSINFSEMKRCVLSLVLAFITFGAFAHQADISTMILIERENNSWVLQINGALTAFQHEVRTHFAETPYKTPEEFQKMVLAHMRNNLFFNFNGEEVKLVNGAVHLGHETKVVFEVLGIPPDVKTVQITNTAFKDIHKNQSVLVLSKNGFKKKQCHMNDANEHTIKLLSVGNTFKSAENDAAINDSSNYMWLAGTALMVLATLIIIAKIFKPEEELLTHRLQ